MGALKKYMLAHWLKVHCSGPQAGHKALMCREKYRKIDYCSHVLYCLCVLGLISVAGVCILVCKREYGVWWCVSVYLCGVGFCVLCLVRFYDICTVCARVAMHTYMVPLLSFSVGFQERSKRLKTGKKNTSS